MEEAKCVEGRADVQGLSHNERFVMVKGVEHVAVYGVVRGMMEGM